MEGWTWPWAWGFLSIPQEWPRKHSDKSSIDFSFFQPLSILISLENGQIHLHIKSWRTFSSFPRKCRENDCSSSFCLKNGVTWVTPYKLGNFNGDPFAMQSSYHQPSLTFQNSQIVELFHPSKSSPYHWGKFGVGGLECNCKPSQLEFQRYTDIPYWLTLSITEHPTRSVTLRCLVTRMARRSTSIPTSPPLGKM